ncbi:uncharacterized protein JCM6883_002567 [Sporobolomyces salmoneus]|uniref:uncharacterized protein n=1 Tax=Sporobolomyces salmoneus TaxID=183962 RepID=UPI00317AAA67
MFGSSVTQLLFLVASSALVSRVNGDVVPTAPGPGDSFNEGSPCPIQWNLDTTDTWTNFTIQLMTGSNQVMTPLATVASGLDGTSGTGKLSWTCPEVDPNSAVNLLLPQVSSTSLPPPTRLTLYPYTEFTQAGAPTSWTTRFTIASASGETTEPTETVMVNGQPVGWGNGRLSGDSVSLSSDASPSSSARGAGSTSTAAVGGAVIASSSSSAAPSGMTTIITTSSVAPSTSTVVSPESSSSSRVLSRVAAASSSTNPAAASGISNQAAQSSTVGNGASSLLTSTSVVSGTVLLAFTSFFMFA